MRVAVWVLVFSVGIIVPITSECASVTIEKVVIKPRTNTDLCIRTSGSEVKLRACSLGTQVFEKIKVTHKGGVQIRTLVSRVSSSHHNSHCLLSSTTRTTSDVFGSTTTSSKLLNGNCNNRSRFQVWDVRTVGSGFQVVNRGTKKCVSADPVDDAVIITSSCSSSDDNQSWTFVNADNLVSENNIGDDDTFI